MHTERERRRRRTKERRFRRALGLAAAICLLALGWRMVGTAIHAFRGEWPEKSEETAIREANRSDGTESYDTAKEGSDSRDSSEELLLVNKDHPLEDSYRPDLVKLRDYGIQVDASIQESLMEMLRDGETEGLCFWIASGYRDTDRQRELLDEDIEALIRQGYSPSEAYEEVVQETMPVGCSEHATGLAVDIVAKDYQILDEKQGRTDEIRWLQENCARYGFILRYPEGKEEITKVSYESWHFRYVGKAAAEEIMEEGITLEEYLEEAG